MAVEHLITGGVIVSLFSLIASALIAFGMVKGKLHSFVKHEQHRALCHEKSVEVHTKIDQIAQRGQDQRAEILQELGKIQGILSKMNGGGSH